MQVIKAVQKALLTAFLGVIGLLLLFPVVITFTNSLMTEQELEINYGVIGKLTEVTSTGAGTFVNLKWVPDQVTLEQYGRLLVYTPKYLVMFWNSAGLVLPIIAGQTAVAAMAAYALSKLRFRGRDALFLVYLLSMLMPFQVTLVPNYIMADKLGLLHSPGAVILPGVSPRSGYSCCASSCCISLTLISKPPKWTAPAIRGYSWRSSCRWSNRDWQRWWCCCSSIIGIWSSSR